MAADKRVDVRMQADMLEKLTFLAQKLNVSRAHLIKYYLSQAIEEELKKYNYCAKGSEDNRN